MAAFKLGGEFLVNTETQNYQIEPAITGLTNGGFVVAWMDQSGLGGDANGFGIKAQVFDAAGARTGTEFLVNTVTENAQHVPAITGLSNGGFVVTWQDQSGLGGDASGSGIKAQVFDAAGAKTGTEFLVNTETANDQGASAITGLSSGGFVVTWSDASGLGGDASGSGIKAQVFDAAGARIGSEFLVNTETLDDQGAPIITGLANGGFVVTWQDQSGLGGDASSFGVKAQVFDAAGARIGSEFLVNTETLNDQYVPTITGLSSGGFVVTWMDGSGLGGDAEGFGIKAQVFDASGARIGSEFLVNTETIHNQFAPTITGLTSGGFVVTWQDSSRLGADASGSGVKAQVFDAAGARIGGEFLVNTVTENYQYAPTITGLTNGGLVIAWSDTSGLGADASGSGIKAQIFALTLPDTTAPLAPTVALAHDTGNSSTDQVTRDGTLQVTPAEPGGVIEYSTDGSGIYSSSAPGYTFADGQHSVLVRQVDAAGNVSLPTTFNFVVDTMAPLAPMVTLAHDTGSSGTDRLTRDGTVSVAPAELDGAIEYSVDGGLTYSSSAPGYAGDGSADGKHSVLVRQVDAAGNASAPSFFSFILDTTAPLAPVVTLAHDTGSSGTDRVTRDGAISVVPAELDGAIEYSIDGGLTYSTAVPSYATDGSADGEHNVLVRQVDTAGNVSLPTTFDFVLDSTAPTAGVTSARLIQPAGGGETLQLAGTVEQAPGTTVQVLDDTTDLGVAVLSGDGHWSFSGSLGAGPHDIQVVARDLAGNLSPIPVTPIGNAAPTGELMASGALVRGQTLSASNTLADVDGLGTVHYQWQRADATGDYTDIADASQRSYLLTRDDIGHSLRLVATYVDGAGSTETVTGAGTGLVAARSIAAERIDTSEVSRPVEAMTSSDVAVRLADGDVLAPAAGTSQIQLADGLIHYAADSGAAYLARLYSGLLGRDADDNGLSFWTYVNGTEPDKLLVASGFLDSAEYQARHPSGTDAEFVDSLYRGLLGREAEDAGRAYFLDLLTHGVSRAEVLMGVADSAEAREHWDPLTAAGVFVPGEDSGLIRASYAAAFGREAEAGGLVFFDTLLKTGITLSQLGDGFENSIEFHAVHDAQTDHDFIASLYQNGLGRDGSAAEVGFYETVLASQAADRGDVLMAFATSPEGQAHLQWSL
ncbi:DUF4214 domain-containing protein [Roseomonas haemaphysalidis]|uniref:DUF4214 domain-containing protein n=1 Tax=Roseomonas haemaphysalidis TaxID=2768162 RepID=A0ABS3KWG2_9PROT|nr:DUF4214 domain-containing protein [Roseomonas haemaphysalidis]MBO1081784.1 DUF4214 domain-containing protein [Roseomonas haemaphysalidis]